MKMITVRVPLLGIATGKTAVETTVSGCTGYVCREITAPFQRALGRVQSDVDTPDAYNTDPTQERLQSGDN